MDDDQHDHTEAHSKIHDQQAARRALQESMDRRDQGGVDHR